MNNFTLDENHIYRLNDKIIPGCSEILKDMGLSDYSNARQDVLEAAAKFGSAVHKACDLHDRGTLDYKTLSAPLVPYLDGWKKFISDYQAVVVPDWIERISGSLRWRFGVTPDRVLVIKDRVVVCEIKSTTSIMRSVALQTAAQKIAVEENYGKVHRRIAVQLTDSSYKIHEFKNQNDEETFICARKLYAWKKENL